MGNSHLIDLEWNEDEQGDLKTLVQRYTSRGASGVCRVHRWRLACFSLLLRDTVNRNGVSGQWHHEWPLNRWVESPIFRWLRETFLAILFKDAVEYLEPDQDDASREMLLPQERNKNAPPSAPPPQKAVLFCPLTGQICYLNWWLTKFCAYNVDIFHMRTELGNDERTEMLLEFQDSLNPSAFITTPKVGGTGLNLTAADHSVITQKFWVLNKQWQTFAWVVRLGQNRVPHTWLLNTCPGGYNNCVSNLHKHSGVMQMRILHGLLSRLNITTSMIYRILEAHEDHTKRLTENRDTLEFDEPLILEC